MLTLCLRRYRPGLNWIPRRPSRQASSISTCLSISDEVQSALKDLKPVVALESTIYTHGFPYPENLDIARHLENVVRRHGATPATIAVLDGIAHIGLEGREISKLLERDHGPPPRKLSARDLAFICGLGMTRSSLRGGTTIAATMHLAKLAGISVFATGGLGGVHRGGQETMDISADLSEFGRSNVNVVCSGCKGFLDIPRTLEYLETQGIGVATFAGGRTGDVDFPAFWTRDSGCLSPWTVKDPAEAANIIMAQRNLGFGSGLLFANPIPGPASIPREEMEAAIEMANAAAAEAHVTGPRTTPFVLQKLHEITSGRTIAANKILVEANVVQGTKLAKELSELGFSSEHEKGKQASSLGSFRQKSVPDIPDIADMSSIERTAPTDTQALQRATSEPTDKVALVVAGSLAIDTSCDYTPLGGASFSLQPHPATSNPASITHSLGGVATNIAVALNYLGVPVRLCSAVGNDALGATALSMIEDRGLSANGIMKLPEGRTGQYIAVNDASKDLVLGMADMKIMEQLGGNFDNSFKDQVHSWSPSWLVIDSTWDTFTLNRWISEARSSGVKVAFEPVSRAKSRRLFDPNVKIGTVAQDSAISLATPNALELAEMHDAASKAGLFDGDEWWQCIDVLGIPMSGGRVKLVRMTNATLVDKGIPQQCIQLLPFIPTLLVKLGNEGVLMAQLMKPNDPRFTSPDSSPYILTRGTQAHSSIGGVYMRLFPPIEHVQSAEMKSVNGVGDTFMGVIMAGLITENPKPVEDIVDIAQRGAVMTLKHTEAVSPEIASLRKFLS